MSRVLVSLRSTFTTLRLGAVRAAIRVVHTQVRHAVQTRVVDAVSAAVVHLGTRSGELVVCRRGRVAVSGEGLQSKVHVATTLQPQCAWCAALSGRVLGWHAEAREAAHAHRRELDLR